jgi:hypothetical protein
MLKGIRSILGSSRFALRIVPAIGGVLWILGTAWIVRLMGGKRWAMILASTAAFASTGNFFQFHYYSMNFWDLLLWQACFIILLHIIKTQNARLWLLFGIVAGVGLENKISILFLLFGLGIGLLLTKERKQLKSLYFWGGMGLAVLLFLPYILWNLTHDWATLEFMHNARTYKNAPVTPVGFFLGQVLYNHPVTLLIWAVGLASLFFTERLRPFRLFGWLFLSIYILFTIQQAKDYYLAAAYPILFAAGGIQWEHWLKGATGKWLRPVLAGLIVFSGLALCPITLPILPVQTTARLAQSIGVAQHTSERHEMGQLPQHFADMFGWEGWAEKMAVAWNTLDPAEKEDCVIYVLNYGEAGAIDFFGPEYGLPNAFCTHNNYWYWGPPEWNGTVALIPGISHDRVESQTDLEAHFQSVEYAATTSNPWSMPYENGRHIFVCRHFLGDFSEVWNQDRNMN